MEQDTHKWYPHIWRDWVIVLLVGTALTLSVVFFHFSLYLDMSAESFFSGSQDLQKDENLSVNRNGLSFVMTDFSERKERSDLVTNDRSKIIDPSTGNTDRSVPKTTLPASKQIQALFAQ
ncbi:MAG: hypothetical protein NTZ13_04810 [Candidatus Parcubacteria bacterium]|nr:hypothetical protein [Candidatus Parcubacteria bacterium]